MEKQFVLLATVLLWSGCILAISFMESWLKFRAPGVTVPVGLSIGKLVFKALNKMEWFFAVCILVTYLLQKEQTDASVLGWLGLSIFLLLVQTFWLLPALYVRANAVINGQTLAASSLHWYFVGAELIKLSSLLVLGFLLFKGFAT